MPPKALKTLDVRSRRQWRAWLQKHHATESEVWLVFHKRHTGVDCLGYDEAVQEALCFGWIDSIIRRLDEDRYARKFTPRKPDSRWSAINRRRYAELKERGLLAQSGLERPPTDRSWDPPPALPSTGPDYIEQALKAHGKAWDTFAKLAPSHRRAYVGWIDMAKREETRARRLAEAIELLAAGRELGLK